MPSKPFYEVGRYACKIVSQALGETGTGKPQFAIRFTVLGLVDVTDPTRFIPAAQQYERTHYRTITDKTIPYFVEDLKILGFTGSSFRQLDPNTDDFHDFAGADVDMWCAHEPGQDGNQQEKWGVARKGGGTLDVKPLDSKKVRELDNLFGKHLKGMKPAAPFPATTGIAVPVPPKGQDLVPSEGVDDSDVPF